MPKVRSAERKKAVKPVFRIFCEGKKTEPYYFKGYIERYHSDDRRLLVWNKPRRIRLSSW